MQLVNTPVERQDEYPSCPRCGGSCTWEDCDECGGEGFIEDDDPDYEPDLVNCPNCRSKGGWWRCGNSYEWCQANPLPGKEQTARAH